MPLVTVQTYRNSAILTDIVINGADTVSGFYENYTVTGIMSNGSNIDLTTYTTWSVTVGNTYASINASGQVTNTNNNTFPHYVTIEADVTYNSINIVETKELTILTTPDVYYNDVSLLLSGDTSISIETVTITGDDSVAANGVVDYSVIGTFSDNSSFSVDNFTTWSIISGGSYGSINSSTGQFTANNVEGIVNVTIRATTYYNNDIVLTDKTISVIDVDNDFYFNNVSLMLAGDSNLTLVSTMITGSATVKVGVPEDYSVTGTFSDSTSSNVDASTTWEIISGGAYASINSTTGVVTANVGLTTVESVTIRATTTFGQNEVTDDLTILVYAADLDPYFNNNSMMLSGDIFLTLVSTVINGDSTLIARNNFDYSVTGTFSDSTSSNMDASTTWEIISGGAYASINSTTGVVTAGESVTGIQSVTIRSTTTFGEDVVYANKVLSIYGADLDPNFNNTSLLLAGDSNIELVSVVISGAPSISSGNNFDYSVTGTLSDNSTLDVGSSTTWEIVSGGAYASINSTTGVVTANGGLTSIHEVVIKATTEIGFVTTDDTHTIRVHASALDPFFAESSLMLSGDLLINLVSTVINGSSTLTAGNNFDYSVTGTFSDSSTANMDASTTWEITVGGAYASINSTTGVVTAGESVTGIQSVTIQSTTTYDNDVVYATKNITVYGADLDPNFNNVSLLLVGDSSLTLASTTINGNSSIGAGNNFDYSVTGTFSDSSTTNMDASTTWEITVGGAYASINSTTGVVTAGESVTGIQSVTIRSTTTFGDQQVQATKNISIIGIDNDAYFSSVSVLLAGDNDV